MRYVSLFSGIEAASVAWEPLGWEPVAFAEIEPFCCELLKARFPKVENLGDVSEIDWTPYAGTVDLVVGGSPCQAFSYTGKRQGLLDERSRLMLEYIRAVHDIRPRWMLWENVPGVLSQSGGDAFDTLLGELEQCGYSLAWRVLDAQHFGVAQRRRRVFVVGHPRIGCASSVLFERESLRWDSPSSKEKRKRLTDSLREGSYHPTYAIMTCHPNQNGTHINEEISHTLDCAQPEAVAISNHSDVCVSGTTSEEDTLSDGYVFRRLTPTECERLQGFPDGWTDLGGTPDAPRYRALGNSMAVPVMRWIGERIQMVDSIAHGAGILSSINHGSAVCACPAKN